jgi:hypothetical protein
MGDIGATVLLVVREEAQRETLRAALERFGYHVVALDGEGHVEGLMRGIAVDAVLVQGDAALVAAVAAAAGTLPWIALEGGVSAAAAVGALLAARRPVPWPN